MRFIVAFLFLFNGFVLQAQTVYKTPSGKKYHTATCRSVKNVSEGLSISAAQSRGLTACLICNPTAENTRNTSPSTTGLGIKKGEAQGSRATSIQCRGTTKKGARCKRMTKNVNGYCFQHE